MQKKKLYKDMLGNILEFDRMHEKNNFVFKKGKLI